VEFTTCEKNSLRVALPSTPDSSDYKVSRTIKKEKRKKKREVKTIHMCVVYM
jgi:hypothetical protein